MIEITIRVGGQPLVAELDDVALAAIAGALKVPRPARESTSPLMSIPEAAERTHPGARPDRPDELERAT